MTGAKSPSHESVALAYRGWRGSKGFFPNEFCSVIEIVLLNMLQKFEDSNCFGTRGMGQKAQT